MSFFLVKFSPYDLFFPPILDCITLRTLLFKHGGGFTDIEFCFELLFYEYLFSFIESRRE